MSIGQVVDGSRLVVCVGGGGVGKTTLAAALAVGAAARGRRAMVLTIDPARALGRALGLPRLGSEPERISGADGFLHAAMLDQKRSWDAFIARHAPSPACATPSSTIRSIASCPCGSPAPSSTSPSRSCAGFRSPASTTSSCSTRRPRRMPSISCARRSASIAFSRRSCRTGSRRHRGTRGAPCASWCGASSAPPGGGRSRSCEASLPPSTNCGATCSAARGPRGACSAPGTAFLLVTTPTPQSLTESGALRGALDELGIRLAGVIENRAHALPGSIEPGGAEARAESLLAELGESEASAWLRRAHADALARARDERALWQKLRNELPPGVEHATVAELSRDMCALADLRNVAERLWS